MKKITLTFALLFLTLGQANSFIIDDFNVQTTVIIADTVVGGTVLSNGSPSSEGIVMNGDTTWTRGISANLMSGNRVATTDCASCQTGHIESDAVSVGRFSFAWLGGSVKDLRGYSELLFDWKADLSGATAWAHFGDNSDTAVTSSIALSNDAVLQTYTLTLPEWNTPTPGYRMVGYISLWFDGVEGLDASIDNVRLRAVPEPATLALIGLGLVGIGYRRRKAA